MVNHLLETSHPLSSLLFSARADCPQSRQRRAHQSLDMGLTLGVLDRQGARGSITGQSLRLAAQLGIEVAARQLEERVRRILFHERAYDAERLFVLLIVAMQVQGEIKARDLGGDNALRHGVFEQTHSVLL